MRLFVNASDFLLFTVATQSNCTQSVEVGVVGIM